MDVEHRARFELAALRFCRPLHWASLPPVNETIWKHTTVMCFNMVAVFPACHHVFPTLELPRSVIPTVQLPSHGLLDQFRFERYNLVSLGKVDRGIVLRDTEHFGNLIQHFDLTSTSLDRTNGIQKLADHLQLGATACFLDFSGLGFQLNLTQNHGLERLARISSTESG